MFYKHHGPINSTFWRMKEWAMFRRSTLNFHGCPFSSTTLSTINMSSLPSHTLCFVAIKSCKYFVQKLNASSMVWPFTMLLSGLAFFLTSIVYALDYKFPILQQSGLKGASWYQRRKEEILSLAKLVWLPHHFRDHPLFLGPQFLHKVFLTHNVDEWWPFYNPWPLNGTCIMEKCLASLHENHVISSSKIPIFLDSFRQWKHIMS